MVKDPSTYFLERYQPMSFFFFFGVKNRDRFNHGWNPRISVIIWECPCPVLFIKSRHALISITQNKWVSIRFLFHATFIQKLAILTWFFKFFWSSMREACNPSPVYVALTSRAFVWPSEERRFWYLEKHSAACICRSFHARISTSLVR